LRPEVAPLTTENRPEVVTLGLEIADIIDELHMLERLFWTQYRVLNRLSMKIMSQHIVVLKGLGEGISTILERINHSFLVQVKQMITNSERVYKSILDLLDLHQKEENIRKAKRANQQAQFSAKQVMSAQATADATEAQSWILFVFTSITTIFLPLSFFTALVTNKAMRTSGGTIAFVFAVDAAIYYFWGKHVAAKERTMWLIDLEDKKFLPSDLMDSKDQ
jgi:hypothetical protein